MDLGGMAELGVAGIAMIAVVVMVDLLRRKFRESEKGDRRAQPEVIHCPNKGVGMAKTLEGILKTLEEQREESRANRKLQTEQLRVLAHVCDGTDRLVEQHKAGADGVESWKVQPRMIALQEESRDLLKDLVRAVKNGGRR